MDQGANTASGSHTYASSGTFTVTFTVLDDDGGSHFDTMEVTVDASPKIDAGPDQVIQLGSSFDPVFSFIEPGAADTHAVVIDWGDGSATSSAAVDQIAHTATSTHLYSSNGRLPSLCSDLNLSEVRIFRD